MTDPRTVPAATDPTLASPATLSGRGQAGQAGSGPSRAPEQPHERRPKPGLHLLVGTPKEVLARIVPGDPLDIRARLATRIRKRALLVDTDRVLIRCFACVARAASELRGELSAWLDTCIDEALSDIVAADRAERLPAAGFQGESVEASPPGLPQGRNRGADSPGRPLKGRPGARVVSESGPAEGRASAHASAGGGLFRSLAEPLGLDPAGLVSACSRFNALATGDREAFFQLVLEARSLEEAAHENGMTGPEFARRARRALDVFLSGD